MRALSLKRAFAVRNEKGIETVEWVIIIILVVVAAVGAFTALSGGVQGALGRITALFGA